MKKLMLFAAAIVALAACNKNNSSDPQPQQGRYFEKGETITISSAISGTKITSQPGGSFIWQEGDQIKVTVGGSSSYSTVKSLSSGGAQAEFSVVFPEAGNKYEVQYPANEASIDLSNQTYKAGCLPDGKMLFKSGENYIPESGTASFMLHPQYAALQMNLYGTDQTISKIVVTDISAPGTKPTYTLNFSPALTLNNTSTTATAFYLVMPVGTYAFSAEVFDNAATPASICKFESAGQKSFSVGEIYNTQEPKEVKKEETGFTITYVQPGEGKGTISGPATAKEGNDVGVSYDDGGSGAAVYSWTVKTTDETSVGLTADNLTTAAFVMPNSNVVVSVVPKPLMEEQSFTMDATLNCWSPELTTNYGTSTCMNSDASLNFVWAEVKKNTASPAKLSIAYSSTMSAANEGCIFTYIQFNRPSQQTVGFGTMFVTTLSGGDGKVEMTGSCEYNLGENPAVSDKVKAFTFTCQDGKPGGGVQLNSVVVKYRMWAGF